MTGEELFRAVGNADDKYIKEISGLLNSENREISFNTDPALSSGERTIVMDVVEKKKTRKITIAAVAAVIAVTAAAAAVALGTKKDKNEYREKKIENYFRSTELTMPENVIDTDAFAGGQDCFWLSATLYDSGQKSRACFYSTEDGKIREFNLEGYEGIPSKAFLTGNSCFVLVSDNARATLVRTGRETLKADGEVSYQENVWPLSVTENEDGTVTVTEYVLTDAEISSMSETLYDRELKKISSREVTDSALMTEGTVFRGYLPYESGRYSTFYQDSQGVISMYIYDENGSLLTESENITGQMPGVFLTLFLSDEGNPVIGTYENSRYGERVYFNELNSETGQLVHMYESTDEILAGTGGYLNIADSRDPLHDGYDFRIFSGGSVYGYSLETDECTELFNPEDSRFFSFSGNMWNVQQYAEGLFVCGYDETEGESGTFLCKTDAEGNIIQKIGLGDGCTVRSIRAEKDGTASFLCDIYADGVTGFFSGRTVKDSSEVKTVNLRKENICTDAFIRDDSGNTAVGTVEHEIVFFSPDGSEAKTVKTDSWWEPDFFRSGDEFYTIFSVNEDDRQSRTVVRRLDFENHTVSEPVCEFDFTVDSVSDSTGEYDAVFSASDGIYGFRISDGSVTEIVNWLDSDITDGNIESALAGCDLAMIKTYEPSGSFSGRLRILNRVTGDELENIKKRPVLNVAVSYPNDGLRQAVGRYNSENENVRIHIEDYSKYYNTEHYFSTLGTASRLQEDVISGTVPDIIISDSGTDFMRYSKSGFLEDMSGYLEGSTDRSEYFENILDAYSVDGKQYGIPLTFALRSLRVKADASFEEPLNYDNFFSMENELFSANVSEYLISFFITGRLGQFIDWQHGSCSFDSENFVKLLEMIKKYGVSQEEYYNNLDGQGTDTALELAEDRCLFDLSEIWSFESYTYDVQRFGKCKVRSMGLPSENGSSYPVLAQMNASMFRSGKHKQEAWDFIRFLLTDESQKELVMYYQFANTFPLKKSAFDELAKLEKAKIQNTHTSDIYGNNIRLRNISDAETEEIRTIVSSASEPVITDSAVRKIIEEQTGIYLAGGQSAVETAAAVQQKVSMYLREIR